VKGGREFADLELFSQRGKKRESPILFEGENRERKR